MRKSQHKSMDAQLVGKKERATLPSPERRVLSKLDIDIAIEFRNKLLEVGWNQTEAARRLQVTRAHVNNICRLRGSPSPHLRRLLDMEVEAFNRGSPDGKQVAKEYDNIRRALFRFPPDKRKLVARRLLSLIEAF